MFDENRIGIERSSMTYSKIMNWIASKYGIPAVRPFSRGPLFDHLTCQAVRRRT